MSAYQVLYRKYRPRTFSDVVGQPQVTTTLTNELKSGRVNHAYLFTGTRGTGKTSCAKILSKAVNCLNPHNGEPCCECEICKGIDRGEIFDVVEMDAASNRGIDDIRKIVEKIAFTPERGKYRVFIVDEVHMLTTEAFNALLKTLEEPPSHVIFILATTEVHKLPATILSRCQRFDFHRISATDVAGRVKFVTENEGGEISDEAALLIAVIADGAVRDALSLLDRCLSLSQKVTVDTVRTAAGLAQKDYLLSLASACVNKNSERAISTLNKLYKDSKDMAKLCDELINHYRSLMLIKTVRNPRELIVMSDEEYDTAFDQAQILSLADIVYAMDVLQSAFERMSRGADNRIELEIALVKLSAPELDSSIESLLTRISALEKAVKCGIPTASATPVSTPLSEAQENKPQPERETEKDKYISEKEITELSDTPKADTETPEIKPLKPTPTPPKAEGSEPPVALPPQNPKTRTKADMNSIMQGAEPLIVWPEIVQNLKKYSRAIASSFEGTNAYISGDYLLIDAKNDIPFKLLQNSSQRENLRQAVQEITGKRYILGPYKPSEEKKEEKNPLDTLADELRSSGIEVIEE